MRLPCEPWIQPLSKTLSQSIVVRLFNVALLAVAKDWKEVAVYQGGCGRSTHILKV